MKIRARREFVIAAATIAAFVVTMWLSPSPALRIALSLPVLLFLTGYSLALALVPRRYVLDGIEWVALGFGLSIAATALIGLALNYTPFGVRFVPLQVSGTGFILACLLVSYIRQRLVPAESGPPSTKGVGGVPGHGWNRASVFVMAALAVAGIALLGYTMFSPNMVRESFTEFYIAMPREQFQSAFSNLKLGQEVQIPLSVENREDTAATYYVQLSVDGAAKSRTGPLALGNNAKWSGMVKFAPDKVGGNQKVELFLYRDGTDGPYRRLYFLTSVGGN